MGLIKYNAKDPEAVFPKTEQLRPPEGAPDEVVVLFDDVGFDASSAVGGPCQTPNAERLAKNEVQSLPYHGALFADAQGPSHIIDMDHMAHVRLVKKQLIIVRKN